jgi:hypothetical protein
MTSAELLVDAFGRIRQVVHRGQVIGGLPGATEEDDGADPTGAGRGHRLTARAYR